MEIMKSLDNKPLCLREEILLAAKCWKNTQVGANDTYLAIVVG